ncbi:MAG: ATP synthase F1 subunit epsilon [Pirellulales bacterium]
MADHTTHHDSPAHASGGRHLQLIVVTPEATTLDEPVDFVALPLYDGETGIAPGRAPLIGRLGYGELRLVSAGHTRRFYVDGGFVQVAGDVVSVLTNRALTAESVDTKVAAEMLAEARHRKANSDELLAARERAEQQARAQLRVASHAK